MACTSLPTLVKVKNVLIIRIQDAYNLLKNPKTTHIQLIGQICGFMQDI